MNLFDKRITILKDETPLLEQFIPENILHREGQKQEIANCMRPVTLNRKPRNSFLYGPCGTGKTLMVQFILKELEGHSTARTAYVNCWKRNTTHAVLVEILNQLDIFTNYRQSVAELLKTLERQAQKKSIVIALDEVDCMEDNEILYNITRSGIGLVCISNDAYALMDLDPRVKSSIAAESIEFPEYNDTEIFEILNSRKQYAFVPGSIKEAELRLVARLARGDARVALETVRRAALVAEDEQAEQVTQDHVKKAYSTTQHLRKTEALKKLNPHEKKLYLLLEEEKQLGTKELWDVYCKKMKDPASQRSYRNYMNHLCRLGLVKSFGELTGRKYEFLV